MKYCSHVANIEVTDIDGYTIGWRCECGFRGSFHSTPEDFIAAAKEELVRRNPDLVLYFLQHAADRLMEECPRQESKEWWWRYYDTKEAIAGVVHSMPRKPPHKAMFLFPRW